MTIPISRYPGDQQPLPPMTQEEVALRLRELAEDIAWRGVETKRTGG